MWHCADGAPTFLLPRKLMRAEGEGTAAPQEKTSAFGKKPNPSTFLAAFSGSVVFFPASLCLCASEHIVSSTPLSCSHLSWEPWPNLAPLGYQETEGESRGNMTSVHTLVSRCQLADLCGCWYFSLETLGLNGRASNGR